MVGNNLFVLFTYLFIEKRININILSGSAPPPGWIPLYIKSKMHYIPILY